MEDLETNSRNGERVSHCTNQENSKVPNSQRNVERVSQEQVHDLLFGEKISWKDIIYDLINTEQLDVWDLDLSLLANRYLLKVRELEEANFFVSSKVLLAASLLLRLKSEIILNHDLPSLDEVLYGKKETKKYVQERIELDDEIPDLIPRTPLPRFKKVTLKELISALGTAINTENRRIKREIVLKQHEFEAGLVIPKNTINMRDKIREIYRKLKDIFNSRDFGNGGLAFSELVELEKIKDRDEKIVAFVSLLHLDTQQKVWLEQEGHFEEIFVVLKKKLAIKIIEEGKKGV
jgi:segregation and condensation protein A